LNNIVDSVIYKSHPFCYYHDRYQSSYVKASEGFVASQGGKMEIVQSGWPAGLQALRRIRHSGKLQRTPA